MWDLAACQLNKVKVGSGAAASSGKDTGKLIYSGNLQLKEQRKANTEYED